MSKFGDLEDCIVMKVCLYTLIAIYVCMFVSSAY